MVQKNQKYFVSFDNTMMSQLEVHKIVRNTKN